VEFRVLGPLEAIDNGTALSLGGPRQRLVLAYLILEANRVVPTDRLIDRIWGEEPPDAARGTLFAYISRLRKLLGPGRILARPPGYILVAERHEVDLLRFTDLVDAARRETDDPDAAAKLLAEALDLWRGGALADLAEYDALRPAIASLEETRLGALEDRIQADMDRARHRESVASLESLTGDHPLRERLWSQLILALYRSGRQGDALAAFHRARKVLVEELGIDPSPELRRLHEMVLQQDPALDHRPSRPHQPPADVAQLLTEEARPTTARTRTSDRPRAAWRWWAAASLAATGILVTWVALILGQAPAASKTPIPNAVLRIDPASGAITGVVGVGTRPTGLAVGDGVLWVANFGDKTVQPLDLESAEAGAPFGGFNGNPTGVAVGDALVWVAVGFPTGQVLVVDPSAHNTILPVVDAQSGLEEIAYGEGALWITNSQQDVLLRISPEDPTHPRRLSLPGAGLAGLAISPDAIWVAERFKRAVLEIDPVTLSIRRTIQVLSGAPDQVAYGEGYVWVANTTADSILRIDPSPNRAATTITGVGNGPTGLAAGGGGVWVANALGRTIARIDPEQAAVISSMRLPPGVTPYRVAFGAGMVWITLQGG
jgi:DNA-binding SARP family transcriptional activator/DNA-binding beta-propeller fold protein YncE